MGDKGTELSSKSSGNPQVEVEGGAKNGAKTPEIDENLARVIASWPGLSDDARRAIVRIVEGATKQL
jgi:hypothetical protein